MEGEGGIYIPFRIRQLYHQVRQRELLPSYLLGYFLGILIMLDFSNLIHFPHQSLTRKQNVVSFFLQVKENAQLTSFL